MKKSKVKKIVPLILIVVLLISVLSVAIVNLCKNISEKRKWAEAQKGITDESIYTHKSDEFEFLSIGKIDENILSVNVLFPARTNPVHVFDVTTWKAQKGFYCNDIPRFRDKLPDKYLNVNISNLLKDEPYSKVKEIKVSDYSEIEKLGYKISKKDRKYITDYTKKFEENISVYIVDEKYILLGFYYLMFDAKTGERYYGIDKEHHTDTVYMPDGEDGKTEPQISFWRETDKIIVVYKLYNKLYIRRLN